MNINTIDYRRLDVEELCRQGITIEENDGNVAALLERCRVILDRPCTAGDGVDQIDWNTQDCFVEAHRRAYSQGRWQIISGQSVGRVMDSQQTSRVTSDGVTSDGDWGRDGNAPLRDAPLRDASLSEEESILIRLGRDAAGLENLNQIEGDLLFLDLSGASQAGGDASHWARVIGGYATLVEEASFYHLRNLTRDIESVRAAFDFVHLTFCDAMIPTGADADLLRLELIDRLNRPLRVCGVTRSAGRGWTRGGGVFWVRGHDGRISLQVIDAGEVDLGNPIQRSIVEEADYFNPVFMALTVRDQHREPFDLSQFVDRDRIGLTNQAVANHSKWLTPTPSLFGGGMAEWNTLFIEVPEGTLPSDR